MVLQILLATVTATTHMTIMSYLFSVSFRELYKKPLLLRFFMQKFGTPLSTNTEEKLGWLMHYMVGLLFVICYQILVSQKLLEVTWRSGILFGFVAGLIGIEWWRMMFKFFNILSIDFKKYYRKLLVMHLIFGLTIVAIYKMLAV